MHVKVTYMVRLSIIILKPHYQYTMALKHDGVTHQNGCPSKTQEIHFIQDYLGCSKVTLDNDSATKDIVWPEVSTTRKCMAYTHIPTAIPVA